LITHHKLQLANHNAHAKQLNHSHIIHKLTMQLTIYEQLNHAATQNNI